MKLYINRNITDSTISLGLLSDSDYKSAFVLNTLENPYLDNEPYISCIPPGDYTCMRVDSPRYGNTFEVMDVPGRSHILFHWGNWEKNTLGCILLGTDTNGKDMIMNSRKAFGQFIKHTKDVDEFQLLIE